MLSGRRGNASASRAETSRRGPGTGGRTPADESGQPPDETENQIMNTYRFHSDYSDDRRAALVIALRRSGYTAWLEQNELHTNAGQLAVILTDTAWLEQNELHTNAG